MTPFDKAIMFDSADFRAIVYVDTDEVIVSNWQLEGQVSVHMHQTLTLTKLRKWFQRFHPDFTETDVTGC